MAGGTGGGRAWINLHAYIQRGGVGTSYSGGCGSGAANSDGSYGWYAESEAGSDIGGNGGKGVVHSRSDGGYGQISIGGTGNPSGAYEYAYSKPNEYTAKNGTGGLLIIYADSLNNNGNIYSQGVQSGAATSDYRNGYYRVDAGGASGGGSINIFTLKKMENIGIVNANGGKAISIRGCAGGAGGNGTISIGQIVEGTYVSTYTNY